jgi:hypothetical protein
MTTLKALVLEGEDVAVVFKEAGKDECGFPQYNLEIRKDDDEGPVLVVVRKMSLEHIGQLGLDLDELEEALDREEESAQKHHLTITKLDAED